MNDEACDIFVSYSSDAGKIADEMTKYFESFDMTVFKWPRDSRDYDVSLKRELENAIKECYHVFVLVTPKALDSGWVNFEIQCADEYNKFPIPVYSDKMDQAQFPGILRKVLRDDDRLAFPYSTWDDVKSKLERMADDEERDWRYTSYIPAGGFGGGKVEFCTEMPKALCQIGDRPMLFHVIDSLTDSPFRKVVVINEKSPMSNASNFIRYVTSLKYPSSRDSGRDSHSHDPFHFKGEVSCKTTNAETWPYALKQLKLNRTFALQLCDIILSFDEYARTVKVAGHWKKALSKHKQMRRKWRESFLGTLITCDYYKFAAGLVSTKGADDEIVFARDNEIVHGTFDININGTTLSCKMNTGTAILEPGILDYIVGDKEESLLLGAIGRALDDGKKFVEYDWHQPQWSHIMHLIDWRNLHKKRLKRQEEAERRSQLSAPLRR